MLHFEALTGKLMFIKFTAYFLFALAYLFILAIIVFGYYNFSSFGGL